MHRFEYTAMERRSSGSSKSSPILHGHMHAHKKSHVRSKVYSMGYLPLTVKKVRTGMEDIDESDISPILGKYIYRDSDGVQVSFMEEAPKVHDIVRFTSQLVTLVGSGVPLLQSIEMLSKQQKSKVFENELKRVYFAIQKGSTLSDALSTFPDRFDVLYVSIVRSGESSGNLDKALRYILDYMERNQKLLSQVKSALTYPSLVVIIAIGVMGALLKFVVPTMAQNLSADQELPQLTQQVLFLSDLVNEYWMHAIIGLGISAAGFISWKKTPSGRFILDRFLFRLPMVGGVLKKISVSRFCNVMSSMLSSGVPLADIFDTCIECCNNRFMSKVITTAKKRVIEGTKLYEALEETQMMPDLVISMISVGEQSGKLDSMLLKVSEYYDEEVQVSTARVLSLIEPLLIVVIGGFIAVILLAMYLPMFEMAGNV